MRSRYTTAFAALALLALPGCDTGSRTVGVGGSGNSALLRIVNATDDVVDLTSGGQFVGGAGHVSANTSSTCIRIDPGTTTLGLRDAGTGGDIGGFVSTLTPGARYTVVVFTSDAGTPLALTLPDDFVPTSGLAGLRIVDVAPSLGSLDVYITPPGSPLGVPSTASIGFGGNTGFFDANPGTSQVRFTVATTATIVFDAGTITLQPGLIYTMVLSEPGGTAATPVASLLPAC